MINYLRRFLPYFSILASSVVVSPNNQPKLVAVSNGKIASALYDRIRNENPQIQEPADIDSYTRECICRDIFSSSHFEHLEEHMANDLNEMYNQLRSREPSFFAVLKGKSTKLGFRFPFGARTLQRASSRVGLSSDLMYTAPTKEVTVYPSEEAQEPIPEYVFSCLNLIKDEGEETLYFAYVSGLYNLSDTSDLYIPGRFLFTYHNTNSSDIDVSAVAEPPAKPVKRPGIDVEEWYLQNRADNEPDDRICALTRPERLRVCTLVFSSEYFDWQPEFVPSYEYVDRSKCTKQRISFQHYLMKEKTNTKIYEEYMITCRLELDNEDFDDPSEYFLSQVHNSMDKVFVYRREEDSEIALENLFINVRFMI